MTIHFPGEPAFPGRDPCAPGVHRWWLRDSGAAAVSCCAVAERLRVCEAECQPTTKDPAMAAALAAIPTQHLHALRHCASAGSS